MIRAAASPAVILAALQGCAVVRAWPRPALQQLASLASAVRYPRGLLLHRHGDCASHVYVVAEGALEFSRVLADGRTYSLPYLGPGQPFGLVTALANEPAFFDLRTRTEATVVQFERNPLRSFLLERPALLVSVVEELSRRQIRAYEQMEVMATMPLRQRLARALLQLAESFGTPSAEGGVRVALRVSQEDLAALTASSRQRVHHELGLLVDDGVLAARYGSITVLNPDGLRARAGTTTAELR